MAVTRLRLGSLLPQLQRMDGWVGSFPNHGAPRSQRHWSGSILLLQGGTYFDMSTYNFNNGRCSSSQVKLNTMLDSGPPISTGDDRFRPALIITHTGIYRQVPGCLVWSGLPPTLQAITVPS